MSSRDAACSLSGPELAERVREWSAVTSRATSRIVEKGKVTATYPRDAGVVAEIRRLIAAEASCCPFMTFDLTERADSIEVVLTVPEDMADALGALMGLASRPPSNAPS